MVRRWVNGKAVLFFLCAFFASACLLSARADSSSSVSTPKFKSGELIVKFKSSIAQDIKEQLVVEEQARSFVFSPTLSRLHRSYNFKKLDQAFQPSSNKTNRVSSISSQSHKLGDIFVVQFDCGDEEALQELVSDYRNCPEVEFAELNYKVSIDVEPNDPRFFEQWHLNNIGQDYPASGSYRMPPGGIDSDIDAPEAWGLSTGIKNVVIAVVDSGVDYGHRDLAEVMWVNEDEIAGNNIDDDGNGYVDDVHGFDFLNYDSDPADDNGHGTHCAGIIAADYDNGLDIAGVCPAGKIMGLKFIDHKGDGYTLDALNAIYYAVDNGADVISNSWGGSSYSQTAQQVFDYAHSHGVVLVASAGNTYSSGVLYPAGYEHVISVAATDSNDEKPSFSTYGSWVDIAAPGVDILSLRALGIYSGQAVDDYTTIKSGTSMAGPVVAGVCGQLLSIRPELDPDEVYDILVSGVDPIDESICKSGRVNLFNSVSLLINDTGVLRFDKQVYSCSSEVGVYLFDSGPDSNDVRSVIVENFNSYDFQPLLLTEINPGSGIYYCSVGLTDQPKVSLDGLVSVSDGDIIEARYMDSDDGDGNSVVITTQALIDCAPPVITNVTIEDVTFRSAEISISSNEPVAIDIIYGSDINDLDMIKTIDEIATQHTIVLADLDSSTKYYFEVVSSDAVFNQTVDSNNGFGYEFETTEFVDFIVPSNFATIQQAVDAAWDGDTIYIEDGIYSGAGNSDVYLVGKAVTLRSFNGPANCIIDCNGNRSNPHRAFFLKNGADSVIEGLTIINGFLSAQDGGAISCVKSRVQINNCVFKNNMVTDGQAGGAVATYDNSVVTLNECLFQGNFAGSATFESFSAGGALYNSWNSVVDVNACDFLYNASDSGGAVYSYEALDADFHGCRFIGNYAYSSVGGAVVSDYVYNVTDIYNCLFNGNYSNDYGAGVGIYGGNLQVESSSFANNIAYSGSAVAALDGGDVYLLNSVIWGNGYAVGNLFSGQFYSGSYYFEYSCIEGLGLSNNLGDGNIGADPMFCDINGYDDVPGNMDDDLRVQADSPCVDAGCNSCIDGDISSDLDGFDRFIDVPEVFDVGAGVSPIVDIGAYERPDRDFVLDLDEVYIEEGDVNSFSISLPQPPVDSVMVTFNLLPDDGVFDISPAQVISFDVNDYNQPQVITLSAFHDQGYFNDKAVLTISADGYRDRTILIKQDDDEVAPVVLYVDANSSGVQNGIGWGSAFSDLQQAIDVAAEYEAVEQIWVARGVYRPSKPNYNILAAFELTNGLEIYGGFAGDETSLGQRDWKNNQSVLSSDIKGDDQGYDNRDDNVLSSVVSIGTDNSAVIDGFVISDAVDGGLYNSGGDCIIRNCRMIDNAGGGIQNYSASPVISGCEFMFNESQYGAGIANYDSQVLISDCVFSDNWSQYGAAIYNRVSDCDLFGCEFVDNYAEFDGGAIGCYTAGYINIDQCRFDRNIAQESGGSLFLVSGFKAHVSETVLSNNEAEYGGAINVVDDINVINCVLFNNAASMYGGGLMAEVSNDYNLTNSIFWNNSDVTGDGDAAQLFVLMPNINYCCVQGWSGVYGGIGNFDADPLFVDTLAGNYQLSSQAGRWDGVLGQWVTDSQTSACIDAGDPNMYLDEEIWPHGGRINAGVYGGSSQASKSLSAAGNIADLNYDGCVNMRDISLLAEYWLYSQILSKADINGDFLIDAQDILSLTENWLWTE